MRGLNDVQAVDEGVSDWANGSRPRLVQILEEKHAITLMIYLYMNDGCRKTDLYRDVSRNPRMPDKLDLLESCGLLVQEPIGDRNAVRISLTDLGREVAEHLCLIESAMARFASRPAQ